MNEQLQALLNEAKENGHKMVRTSPDLYECTMCSAKVNKRFGKLYGWVSIKTSNICNGAQVKLTKKGLAFLKAHPELRALVDCQ